jgi:hypothetical protein
MVEVFTVMAPFTEQINSRQSNLAIFHISKNFMRINQARILRSEAAYCANRATFSKQ